MSDIFDNLETEISPDGKFNPATKKVSNREKFPCQSCCGTGSYRGTRLHQEKSHCFACKGKGYFYTSRHDRMKAKQQRRDLKSRKATERACESVKYYEENHPGLLEFLKNAATWSEFASSMYQAIGKYGRLTEKQLNAALSMRQKSQAREAEKQDKAQNAAQIEKETIPTLGKLAQGFLNSSEHLKFPKLRLSTEEGLRVVLSRCGDRSRTPGHINITDGKPYGENIYYGRITPDGKVLFRNAPDDVTNTLIQFNDDPQAAIKVQGLRTGECCACGRELTNKKSIESGIGPVCAGKWGF